MALPEKDNLSAVLVSTGNLKLEQRPIPKLGACDVLVAVHTVGICGSDVHYWVRGSIGHFIVKDPMVLGHETSGTVVEIGPSVKTLVPGDRIALEPGFSCRLCSYCKSGHYNMCPDMTFCATPPCNGTLTRFFAHPEDFCFKLPDHVSFEEGAFLEPLSVAVHACKKAKISIGQKIFIAGSGPIGLLALLVCKAAGVSRICISEIDENRLKTAQTLGANCVYLAKVAGDPLAAAGDICQLLGGQSDVSIDCCGFDTSVQTSIHVTSSGGILQLVGLGQENVNFPLAEVITREISLQGSFRYANCYPTALALIADGKINVKPLITHQFDLEQTLQAFDTAKNPQSNSIKVMIKCSKT